MKTAFRKNARLANYDYAANGYYFLTICTDYRRRIFEPRMSAKYGDKLPESVVVAGPWPAEFKTNSDIIETKISLIEKKFAARADYYCIMPDHVHLIIAMEEACQGREARQGRATTSLAWIVNAFKGWCTRAFGRRVFQPNYYEHVIRNEDALAKIREYIQNNPEAEKLDWTELDNVVAGPRPAELKIAKFL